MPTSSWLANAASPSPLRALTAILVASFSIPVHATTHTLDVMSALIQEYSRDGSSAEYLARMDDASYERYVLNRPGFPYADVIHVSLAEPDAPTRRVISRVSTAELPVNSRDLHDMKVWDLGYTKARIGREISRLPDNLRNVPGAPSLMKAGVDADIYVQAFHLSGADYPMLAANYALAAQLLRSRLATTPRNLWMEHGLRHDVLDRFLHAATATSIHDHDLYYLIHVLDGELSTWSAGALSSYGLRDLPTDFRLARMAAAYRDRLPYEHEPCLPGRTYDARHAGMGGVDKRPLCFDDATDRAVHRWYAAQFRTELSSIRSVPRSGATIAERMAMPLNASRQGWIGIRRNGLIEDATRLEVVEAKITDRLHAEGLLSYRDTADVSRRALQLTCARGH